MIDMANSAYEYVRNALMQQRFYIDVHGSKLYEFRGVSGSLFSFTLRTLDGKESPEYLYLEGLQNIHPVNSIERKRVLAKFGLEDKTAKAIVA